LIQSARARVAQAVNSALVLLYWQVGQRIRTEVLKNRRAGYGEQILPTRSAKLVPEYGQGFSERNLARMVRFAEVFPDGEVVSGLSRHLGWSHFVEIIYLSEKDLESAILREMERFILELGGGFTFIARQKRIVIDGKDFYIDLLFYHRKLRRLIAIDLKLAAFQATDKGQMELYLRWLERHETETGEDPPLGLILCAGKLDEHVELLQLDKSGIRVAAYLTELPPRRLLERKLHESALRAKAHLEARGAGSAAAD